MTSLHKSINRYFELDKEIKEAFGWEDSWKVLPFDDCRKMYWMLAGGDKKTGRDSTVVTSDKPFTPAAMEAGETICGMGVYTQRGHECWVLRGKGVVLIPVDTQTDGNIFLLLLDAEKEVISSEMEKMYLECWGSGC